MSERTAAPRAGAPAARRPRLSRREFLAATGAGLLAGAAGPWRSAAAAQAVAPGAGPRTFRLSAVKAPVRLADPPFPPTRLWCYDGRTPGPEIRVRQGERLRIEVTSRLDEITGIHSHGLRIPNEMDGVAFLTQPPIEPGETFVYEYAPPDAGTFWYHSHENAAEQQGRGLHGPLVVEEAEPPVVDRELTWVLDDWRLDAEAQITEDFDRSVDYSRGGRIGNTVTLNGRIAGGELRVRAGERLRLRLVNSANARIFSLRFQDHRPTVIALDGQPVEPYVPRDLAVTLAPAQRADVILDLEGRPGERYTVADGFYAQNPYRLLELVYEPGAALRDSPLDAPVHLPRNLVPEPNLRDDPFVKEVVLEGGDLGRLRGAYLEGKRRGVSELLLNGKFWAICGVSAFRQVMPPFVTVERGRTCVFDLVNRSLWPHTMHTHGHSFRVLEHQGRPLEHPPMRDTVWLLPQERAKIAFVADNPGDWLFHCHMLSHAYAGMLATFRVT